MSPTRKKVWTKPHSFGHLLGRSRPLTDTLEMILFVQRPHGNLSPAVEPRPHRSRVPAAPPPHPARTAAPARRPGPEHGVSPPTMVR